MNTPDNYIHHIFGSPDDFNQQSSPLYLQLQRKVRNAVEMDLLKAGDALPAEREIDGVPVEFTRSYFPDDYYDFVAEIRSATHMSQLHEQDNRA